MAATVSIKKEARKLAETTSVRGIPRAIKSADVGLRVIWAGAVIICMSLLVWQTTMVVLRYFRYESSTLLTEGRGKPVFPDITICNVYPLNAVDMNEWKKYEQDIETKQAKWSCDKINKALNLNLSKDNCNDCWAELRLPTGFFDSLPLLDDDSDAGDQFIVDCSINDWDWGSSEAECNVKARWDPDYYKCYTIQVDSNYRKEVLGMVAVVYLNDFSQTTLDTMWPNLGQSMAVGIRVSVHGAGTIPDMKTGISIGPGVETTLMLKSTKRVRLPPPFQSQCTTEEFVGNSQNIAYTVDSCVDVCVQEQIIKQCNCVSAYFTFSDEQMRSVNYTVCGNQTAANDTSDGSGGSELNELNGLRDLVCSYNVSVDYDSCQDRCHSPCIEYLYETSVSTSGLWPDPRYQMAFYSTFVDGQPHGEKFSAYKDISDMIENGSLTPAESIAKLRSMDLITRNFLQLNVLFDQTVPFLMTDKQSMTLDNLGAQLGGVLSLWLGITIMTAVEIVEFIYMIVQQYRNNKRLTNGLQNEPAVHVAGKT